jgi:hypothetical protein
MHLGAAEREHQEGELLELVDHRVDEAHGRQVAPVQVLQHEQHRLRGALGAEEVLPGEADLVAHEPRVPARGPELLVVVIGERHAEEEPGAERILAHLEPRSEQPGGRVVDADAALGRPLVPVGEQLRGAIDELADRHVPGEIGAPGDERDRGAGEPRAQRQGAAGRAASSAATTTPSRGRSPGAFESIRATRSSSGAGTSARRSRSRGGSSIIPLASTASPLSPSKAARSAKALKITQPRAKTSARASM